MFKPDLFKGHKILITGGGTGLGKAMGERLLELGADLVICGRRKGVLDETEAELMARHGGKVDTYACDIRYASSVEDMMELIFAKKGR